MKDLPGSYLHSTNSPSIGISSLTCQRRPNPTFSALTSIFSYAQAVHTSRLLTPVWLQSFYKTGVYLDCRAYRSQTSNAAAAASSKATDAPISLQQRMQQALSADIAPATAPKQHAFLERQTGSLGSGQGSGPGSRVASEAENVREEDTGFWDLVYILYPDFAEAAGVGALRELVPHWTLLEKTLMVSTLHSHNLLSQTAVFVQGMV